MRQLLLSLVTGQHLAELQGSFPVRGERVNAVVSVSVHQNQVSFSAELKQIHILGLRFMAWFHDTV